MRARQRHFVARDAGAQMTMDARYIAQSDNTAVTTWANRGSSTYDMTQATTAAKPTFRDGTNGLNGLPTLSFDGNDYVDGINTGMSTYSILAVSVMPATGGLGTIFNRGITTSGRYDRDALMFFWPGAGFAISVSRASSSSFPTATISASTGAYVAYGKHDGTNLGIRANGGAETTTAATATPSGTNAPWTIGATRENNTLVFYVNSKISLVAVWNGLVLSDSLRKRATHAAGYSFKIACS